MKATKKDNQKDNKEEKSVIQPIKLALCGTFFSPDTGVDYIYIRPEKLGKGSHTVNFSLDNKFDFIRSKKLINKLFPNELIKPFIPQIGNLIEIYNLPIENFDFENQKIILPESKNDSMKVEVGISDDAMTAKQIEFYSKFDEAQKEKAFEYLSETHELLDVIDYSELAYYPNSITVKRLAMDFLQTYRLNHLNRDNENESIVYSHKTNDGVIVEYHIHHSLLPFNSNEVICKIKIKEEIKPEKQVEEKEKE